MPQVARMLASIFFWILLVFAVAGIFTLGLVWLAWEWLGRWYGETWAKFVIEAVQLLSALVVFYRGIARKEFAAQWTAPSILGLVTLFVWKGVQAVGDSKTKAAAAADKEALKAAKAMAEPITRQAIMRVQLLSFLRRLVEQKRQRFRKVLAKLKTAPSIKTAKHAMDPRQQIDDILMAIVLFLKEQVPDPEEQHRKDFRVGVYVETGASMQPLHGVSLRDRNYDPFRSYKLHPERFALDCQDGPSHVVRCVRDRTPIIVSDCRAEAEAGTFTFFNEGQKRYLRSLAVFPIGDMVDASGANLRAAVVLDSDSPGFFRPEDMDSLALIVDEFAARLSLEWTLRDFLSHTKA